MNKEQNKKNEDKLKKYNDFLERVENLSKADKCTIKDAAGCSIHNLHDRILIPFYSTRPEIWDNDPEQGMAYLFAAVLYCQMGTGDVSFQERLREIYQDEGTSESMRADIVKIISLYWDENGSMMRHLSKYTGILARDGKKFDIARLLRDLLYWNDEKRVSKTTWAKRISSYEPEKKQENKKSSEL